LEEALKEQERIDATTELNAREDLMLNPDTGFGERFEAVMTDMLAGRHASQVNIHQEGLHRGPTDNDENPTEEF
jgi:hypothetical protein